ncbi:MAG: molybdopterin-binding/glycosyltransferase family 2 protein [Paracoccaceae bacterium]|jgi:molybdenum cofactor cytidylyltransferase
MKFGLVPIGDAKGAILAHSMGVEGVRFRKGKVLSQTDIEIMKIARITDVTVAILVADDVPEDQAAEALAKTLVPDPKAASLVINKPSTGRVNIYAKSGGVLQIDAEAIARFNLVTPSITVATLSNFTRVAPRALVATVKIIPYAVPKTLVETVKKCAALHLSPFSVKTASLILTQIHGMNVGLLDKARAAVENRLRALNCRLTDVQTVPHEIEGLSNAIKAAKGDMILILTASATSDINDVGPAALEQSGGETTRFGMPVDPGNLLFLGNHKSRPVIGLPGCLRSPALNGADWVLERIAAGLQVTDADIAAMGVGGLLKETPTRPHPRSGKARPSVRSKVEIILLAAGSSRRMRGRDKLLEQVNGAPLLRRSAMAAVAAQTDRVHVVMQPENAARGSTLDGLDVNSVSSPEWQEGMAASIRAGMGSVSEDCDAVIIALADMPEVNADHFNRLLSAFDAAAGHEICRAMAADGTPGLPVLFGRRFFETLGALTGDRGARDVINEASEFLVNVPTDGMGAVIDLDTPDAWLAWRESNT